MNQKNEISRPLTAIVAAILTAYPSAAAAALNRLPSNPNYFTDGSGRAIYLTGSHTWNNFQDLDQSLDYAGYLNLLQSLNHNFIRLWVWEASSPSAPAAPIPFLRPGPGTGTDGGPRFDLNQIDPNYLSRLRQRVVDAGKSGIYVSLMLFQYYDAADATQWTYHPFYQGNNINGINGDPANTGVGRAIHTLQYASINAVQKAYVKQVIDTVNDLDNVLYEICNECRSESISWQYDMINYIHSYEAGKPKQHPVGMTSQGGSPPDDTSALFSSPADWISPNGLGYDYADNPPPATGAKIVIADTDHIFGNGGSSDWVWKTFTRGNNAIYMDAYNDHPSERAFTTASWNTVPFDPGVRQAMGDTKRYVDRMNLATMSPRGDLCSTGYCLANPGQEYLAYLPSGGSATINLSGGAASFAVEWFDPLNRITQTWANVPAGASQTLTAAYADHPAVLYIVAAAPSPPPSDTMPPAAPIGLRVL